MAADSAPSNAVAVDLRDPAIAALLAWLVPGLGHWYQRRRAKAILFFVCIMGLFAWGVALSSSDQPCREGGAKIGVGRAVYFAWSKDDHHLPYLCQIGVGLPALPALVQTSRMSNHQAVWWGGFMAPPWPNEQVRQGVNNVWVRTSRDEADEPNFGQPTLDDLNRRLHRYFDLATFFTMVAGLLNVLAIYDACAGPVLMPASEKKEETPA